MRLGFLATVGAEEVLDVGEEELGEIACEVLEILGVEGYAGLGADVFGEVAQFVDVGVDELGWGGGDLCDQDAVTLVEVGMGDTAVEGVAGHGGVSVGYLMGWDTYLVETGADLVGIVLGDGEVCVNTPGVTGDGEGDCEHGR